MKVAIIHSANNGFFPRFYEAIYDVVESHGDECILVQPNNGSNNRRKLNGQRLFGDRLNWHLHHALYKLTGVQDVFSVLNTTTLLNKLNVEKPNVIHLNVVNECCINMPMFTQYVNKCHIPVVWTMHDCRAFTGQCPYFDEYNCERWKAGCGKCPQCATWIDNTHLQWKIRRRWHAGIKDLTIVTPSQWLADYVKESFLYAHPVQVIYNGVDTSIFGSPSSFDVYKEYGISPDKKIVMGIAINWEPRKGMKFFFQLADMLPEKYQIVLVGNIKPEQKKEFACKGVICTGRTKTVEELAAWYQTASVFCNPTLADNFPTTNIESLAAGTPIVTFKTGGSPEAIDSSCGIVVPQGDVQALKEAIETVTSNRGSYTKIACKERSKMFTKAQYEKYYELFTKLNR